MATNRPPSSEHPRERAATAGGVADRARTAQLRARVAALETALERERERRQAVIARYERLLDERTRAAKNDGDDGDAGGLLDRLR
ncbi:hypothetical protein [Halostella litorea]|uniref:hypothetical protein n=1 Tax=Halostella litorea TaxID=2528831 RepID=UPI001091B0DF|nr:hypothetical protein [Halostella litorea]